MTIELSENVIEAIADAVVKKMQEPCEDAVSRAEVLNIINFEDKWLFDAKSHNADTKIAFSGLKSRVKDLPSVTPHIRWIPVSERLPEDNKDVLVQIKNGKDRFFDIAHIVKMKHPAFDKDFYWYWDAHHPWDNSFIEAWMPLPEPYKEE